MGILDYAKDALTLYDKVKDIENTKEGLELHNVIIKLKKEGLRLEDQVIDLKREIVALEEKMTFSEKLTRKNQHYIDDEGVMYCTKCWDDENKAITLPIPMGSYGYAKCPKCGFDAKIADTDSDHTREANHFANNL